MKKLIAILLFAITFCVCADNLVVNASFEEGDDAWNVLLKDGAAGSMESVSGPARTGKNSFRMTKSNGVGYLQLQSKEPVKVQAGKKYVFRGWFHADDSEFSTLLLFRVTRKSDEIPRYDAIDRSAGYTGQSFLNNDKPGEWSRRVIHFESRNDEEIYLNVILYGNPATAWIDDLEFAEANYKIDAIPGENRVTYPYSKEQVYEALAKREAASSRIKDQRFYLNDRLSQPNFYKVEPYLDNFQLRRYTEFVEAGVPLQFCVVGLGIAKNTRGVSLAADQFDFDKLEGILMHALRHQPQANLVVEFFINTPYDEWGAENLDECWIDQAGRRGYGLWGNLEGYVNDLSKVQLKPYQKDWITWWYPSYSSEKYRRDTVRALDGITRKLIASPLGKAVAGFHISGGHDGQFQYPQPDYSPPAQQAFRKYLRQKYQTIENLNAKWDSSFPDFSVIRIPSPPANRNNTLIKSYGAEVDYHKFQDQTSWELKNLFAATVKEAFAKPVTVSCYGMPTAYECGDAVKYPALDMFADASWYPFRKPGYPLGARPASSYALHNKLWILEMDARTWIYQANNEMYDLWLSSARTPEAWAATEKKMSGVAISSGYGWWYYSMNRYFDDPRLMAEIKQTVDASRKLLNPERPGGKFRPDVCLVKSMSSYYHQERLSLAREATSMPAQSFMFELSGVPCDTYYLEEILANPELHDYKVYVFMHNLEITAGQRAQIEKLLKNRNRLLVWVYGSGYLDGNGKSIDAMSELTGIRVRTSGKAERRTPVTVEHPLTAGVQPFQGIGELMFAQMALKGVSSFIRAGQEFWIDDPGTEKLAVYHENGQTCIALKKFPDWTSVYCAAPFSLTNRMIRNLALHAGAFVYGKPGQSVFMNGDFMSLHGIKTEKYEITLPPGKTKIIDLLGGREISRAVDVEAGETYWFAFE